MERLLRFTARKYADSAGSDGAGASSDLGADGGLHDPAILESRMQTGRAERIQTSVVSSGDLFDFDDVCTQVREQHRRCRTCQHPR